MPAQGSALKKLKEAIIRGEVPAILEGTMLLSLEKGASDIHFEPYEKTYRVRFRTDGVLQEVTRPPNNLGARLAARLKVMSQMDISERRLPQDGRIKMKLSKTRAIDFRVNTLPTLYGEKIVLPIRRLETLAEIRLQAICTQPPRTHVSSGE